MAEKYVEMVKPELNGTRCQSTEVRGCQDLGDPQSTEGLNALLALLELAGLDLDADGVPLGDAEEPSSPDKESMSWPGR